MPEKFNPDSFAPFLRSVKRVESTATPAASPVFELLRVLATAPDKRMEAPSLLSLSEMSVEAFARTLTSLEKASLVRIERGEGRELVVVTPAGEQVAAVQP